MASCPATPRDYRQQPARQLEEAPLPGGTARGIQETLRDIYQPAREMPDDFDRLIERLR